MKQVLLDTHIFLWAAINPEKLSKKVQRILESDRIIRYVSIASVWETAYLIETKKVRFDKPLGVFWEESLIELQAQILNITPQHVQRFYEIQPLKGHNDQFDRMIIAQAASTGIPLISDDGKFGSYPMIQLIEN
ncbi:MAG: type II toxin-antitoxin system VapC family toxin [Spirosomaceae bacterium]|jgi:PIN domain nuclease of toxin-antitoxin system|nr:type II toxin-antitoxin system VapC family toxin [Spirosomataceae bacterium]